MLKVQVVNKGHQPLPQYATPQSAGMDLRANIDAPITLKPLERKLIPTGLHIALPVGYEAQVRPRSGLALKKGITVLMSRERLFLLKCWTRQSVVKVVMDIQA